MLLVVINHKQPEHEQPAQQAAHDAPGQRKTCGTRGGQACPASRNVVDRTHHQLLKVKSVAKGRVAKISSFPVRMFND